MKRTWKNIAIIIMAMVLGLNSAGCTTDSFSNTIPMTIEFIDGDVVLSYDNCNFNPIATVDIDTLQILQDCQLQVIEYFGAKNINVTDKLSKLENTFIYNAPNSGVAGYYKRGTCDIYLEANTLQDTDYLKFVYIHELMHYLGFVDNETTMMQEGMADAIAEDILGYYYEYSYDVPRSFCHQLIIADPDILQYILEGGDLDVRIDERLENVPRVWYVPKHNLLMSDVLEFLLYDLEYNYDTLDNDTIIAYSYQCQAIIVAYCNTFDLTEEQIEELSQYIIEVE